MTAPGFARVSRAVLHARGLSGPAKLCYALLQSHANQQGWGYPSGATLAEETGWSQPTVRKALDELVAAGIVERHRRGKTQVNAYRVIETTFHSQADSDGNDVSVTGECMKRGFQVNETTFLSERNVVSTNENHLTRSTNPVVVNDPGKTPGGAGGRAKPESADVRQVFEHYRERIQPAARLIDAARDKIRTRLETFTVDELKTGIDHFAADSWWMDNNGRRGAAWFFHSDARAEQFLHMVPRQRAATPGNGQHPPGLRGVGGRQENSTVEYGVQAILAGEPLTAVDFERPEDWAAVQAEVEVRRCRR